MIPALEYLKSDFGALEDYRPKIDWLLKIWPTYGAIADFGCNIGYETRALAWLLGSTEVVGIDIDESQIEQAKNHTRSIAEDLKTVNQYIQLGIFIDDQDRAQFQGLMERYNIRAVPTFITTDATKPTSLPADHFDLVYCERFLYHFACRSDAESTGAVPVVIREMKRVGKAGALIVAIEPKICSSTNMKPVDLKSSFEEPNLAPVDVHKPEKLDELNLNVYVYMKAA